MEILSNIAPPEREAAWERITVRAAALHADFPEEAMKFFRTIAGDENPMNRASIAGALSGIASPETVELLLALRLDGSIDVQREAYKRLKQLYLEPPAGLDRGVRARIAACLKEELEKGEWIF